MKERMQKRKRAKLEAAGWATGSPKDFLALSDEEAAYVEMKVALGETLRAARAAQKLSQAEMAQRLGSSQSRVAKMEAADRSVSLDLLVRALAQTQGNVTQAARLLGVSRDTLRYRIEKHALKVS
jgi:DNA-binding NtrC family response regulator